MPSLETSSLNLGEKTGNFLTFVVGRKCPLACAFCIVHQRREIINDQLKPEHIAEFARQVCGEMPVVSLSIVGYEPLSPDAIAYTNAIFLTAKDVALPCSMVTNGLELEKFVRTLSLWDPNHVVVSLDSAFPELHDRIRGVDGAWLRTVRGISAAMSSFELRRKISVASVLMPSDRGRLRTMPAFLATLGVRDWRINLLQRVGQHVLRVPAHDRAALPTILHELNDVALNAGINLTVDDELSSIKAELRDKMPAVKFRQMRVDQNIIRLSSSGFCSVNEGIMLKEHVGGLRWTPDWGHAARFVAEISSNLYRAAS